MKYEDVIDHFGSQQAVADAIGIKQPSVAAWKEAGIPEPRQFQLEVITDGRLKADRIPRPEPTAKTEAQSEVVP